MGQLKQNITAEKFRNVVQEKDEEKSVGKIVWKMKVYFIESKGNEYLTYKSKKEG